MICRVRAIIQRGDRLLLVRHKNSATGKPYGTWTVPGGHVEDGEMVIDAMVRELMEETGVKAVVGNLLYVHQFELNGRFEGPEFFFYIENAEDFESIDLASTSHGSQEIAEIGFYDPRTLEVVLPPFLKEITRIDENTPTQLIIRKERVV